MARFYYVKRAIDGNVLDRGGNWISSLDSEHEVKKYRSVGAAERYGLSRISEDDYKLTLGGILSIGAVVGVFDDEYLSSNLAIKKAKSFQEVVMNVGTVDNSTKEIHEVEKVLRYCRGMFGGNIVANREYVGEWEDESGKVYKERCLSVRFRLNVDFLPIGGIEAELEKLCVRFGQEAIAYFTTISDVERMSPSDYCDVFYRGYKHYTDPDSCLRFDLKYFEKV